MCFPKKIIDINDYIIVIEETGIKIESRNKIDAQNINKIKGKEKLKKELALINDDKSFFKETKNKTFNKI